MLRPVILRGHLPIAGTGYFSTRLFSKQVALNLNQLPEGWWNFKDAVPWFAETLKSSRRRRQSGGTVLTATYRGRADGGKRSRDWPSEMESPRASCVSTGAMETCRTFRVQYHQERPRSRPDRRVRSVIYFYWMDRDRPDAREASDLVSLHGASVCQRPRVAGTEAHSPRDRLREVRQCLRRAGRCREGQRRAGILAVRLAQAAPSPGRPRQSPASGLAGRPDYYWVIDQAEFSTDVLFADKRGLASLRRDL